MWLAEQFPASLSIKGDHSDIMYALNTGWIIIFAKDPQEYTILIFALLKLQKK